ncbi:hypothetical protein CEP54_008824 [Fusarium duplospermum]|uniref:Uncharacterized protein n=1 Tax=Fusarium duplospermum TaxID=1325734 RepID=A0A428PU29_9HYPO|nr:hypothetical protein CEP54_008824 [Fusarium duplospermum]
MDDRERRARPEFKTRVFKWLDETTVKVLPHEAKTTVLFWCQSFAPERVRKVEAARARRPPLRVLILFT